MNKLLQALAVSTFIAGCTSRPLVPGFKIGMPENAWKDTMSNMVKRGELSKGSWSDDSLTWDYKLRVGDTVLNSHVIINGDGVGNGSLRVLSFHLATEDGIIKPDLNSPDKLYPSPAEDSVLYDKLSGEGVLLFRNPQGRITSLGATVFPKESFDKLLHYVKEKYGNADSVLNGIGERIDKPGNQSGQADTSLWKHYFHDDNSIIVLQRSEFYSPSYYIPFWHSQDALLYQYSRNFESELAAAKKAVSEKLRPAEIITIPLQYSIENKSDEYGITRTYLNLSAWLEPRLRKTLVETRDIKSLKGKILIKDKYDDLLQQLNAIEIECEGSLPSEGRPGLANAIGEGDRVMFNMRQYEISLYVDHKDNSAALKQAVALNRGLSVHFVPEAIIFTNGDILK